MAIESLQNKIRKGKSVLMADLSVFPEDIPACLVDANGDLVDACAAYCKELMDGLKGIVSSVRFSFSVFALWGEIGLNALSELLNKANSMGYYVLLDAPEILNLRTAEFTARKIFGENTQFPCDGIVISSYLGSDIVKAFLPYCDAKKKDIFVVVRSFNKSAAEIQDLQTGSRLVHSAAADYINRYSGEYADKSGYSRIGVVVSATAANSLRNIRIKYPKLFILADGMDSSGGNAKNCSFAFDKFGHGAVVCVGSSLTGAWRNCDQDEKNYVDCARAAAERHLKNLNRYFSVL